MAQTTVLKPEEAIARNYADQLVLEKLTELYEVVKPSELAESLSSAGLGLATVRSLLASNADRFAYSERRWIPASRLEAAGKPFLQAAKITVERFGAPMPLSLLVNELARSTARLAEVVEEAILRMVRSHDDLFMTRDELIASSSMVFVATDETVERAYKFNGVNEDEVIAVEAKLGDFDWTQQDAIVRALDKCAPVNAKALGAAAWKQLNPQFPQSILQFDWKAFNAELLSIPGFVYGTGAILAPDSATKGWLTSAIKLAEKATATIEIEEAAPLEFKKSDTEAVIAKILASEKSVTATEILETQFEVTPVVKTFPDDLKNIMEMLNADPKVWWVGGDRFRKAGTYPDYVNTLPEPFLFVQTNFTQEDGELVDVELNDDGLSSSLRKLIIHPLAMDVNDEEVMPSPKTMPESVRCVLKPAHRELGTYPLSQFPTDWFEPEPEVQEVILIDKDGRELQVWLTNKHRLIYGLFDWWLDQPVESGAVFSLTKTNKPNVLEFRWLEQTDPVVFISNQRMEELREIAGRSDELSTFDVLREVMAHWPKGADFLTILWEVNVVRRTSRRLLASLLSSYICFYQRSGSPVWHYDHKKVEQGFDKTKKKFIVKN